MPTSDFSNKTYNPGDGEKRKSYPNNNNKSSEKDQMIGLNDKFVQIIDKVKSLEDDKKKLAKKLELLKKQDDYAANIEDLVRQQKNELERKIDSLLLEKDKLDDELDRVQKEKDDNKKRYEDEIVKKQEAEQDFILAKEDVDRGHLAFVDDALKLEKLNRDVEFLRPCFEEEIRELQSLIKNDRVVLPENNKRSLDMDDIIKSVEDQYAKLAARAREETESWNQKKMKDMVSSAAQQQENLREMKKDVADLKRFIQTLNRDLEALKRKEANLRKEIDDLRKEGDENMEKARGDIKLMEEALNKNKQVLAEKIKEHQELLNLKLSLDIEIATYNKLLEGEENRMREYAYNADVHLPERKHVAERKISPKKPQDAEPIIVVPEPIDVPEPTVVPEPIVVQSSTIVPDPTVHLDTLTFLPMSSVPNKRLLIRLWVESGRLVSESSQYTD